MEGKNNTNGAKDEDKFEDSDDYDDEQIEEDEDPTQCLFCEKIFPSIDPAISHLDRAHKVKLSQLQEKFQMDQQSFVKLINYIRATKISAEELLAMDEVLWDDDKYLKSQGFESWLCYDYEILKIDLEQGQPSVLELQELVSHQAQLLQEANNVIIRMRKNYKALLNHVSQDSSKSYSHFGIHRKMLSDKVRTSTYRSALLQNEAVVRGKTVLDVGCGTGILSIFASQAGASKVTGIDNSDIVFTAMNIVRKNNVPNVEFIKGRLEDTQLPGKFDIIISDWIGPFMLYEPMLNSMIYAREHLLNPNGIILPSRCTLNILGYGNDAFYAEHVEFWGDVYNVNMNEMRKKSVEAPLMKVVDAEFMLTEPEAIANFDIMTVDLNYLNYSYNLSLKVTKSGRLTAFVGYFDSHFDLPSAVMFSTSPMETPTHWKQIVLFLDDPLEVKAGQVVSGKFISRRPNDNVNALQMRIDNMVVE
ncbi:hypothetical protein KR018_005395 [Drosophila ironensis]|nr:hypothetical protein KR018_005395 [Drosophila ironensis]